MFNFTVSPLYKFKFIIEFLLKLSVEGETTLTSRNLSFSMPGMGITNIIAFLKDIIIGIN